MSLQTLAMWLTKAALMCVVTCGLLCVLCSGAHAGVQVHLRGELGAQQAPLHRALRTLLASRGFVLVAHSQAPDTIHVSLPQDGVLSLRRQGFSKEYRLPAATDVHVLARVIMLYLGHFRETKPPQAKPPQKPSLRPNPRSLPKALPTKLRRIRTLRVRRVRRGRVGLRNPKGPGRKAGLIPKGGGDTTPGTSTSITVRIPPDTRGKRVPGRRPSARVALKAAQPDTRKPAKRPNPLTPDTRRPVPARPAAKRPTPAARRTPPVTPEPDQPPDAIKRMKTTDLVTNIATMKRALLRERRSQPKPRRVRVARSEPRPVVPRRVTPRPQPARRQPARRQPARRQPAPARLRPRPRPKARKPKRAALAGGITKPLRPRRKRPDWWLGGEGALMVNPFGLDGVPLGGKLFLVGGWKMLSVRAGGSLMGSLTLENTNAIVFRPQLSFGLTPLRSGPFSLGFEIGAFGEYFLVDDGKEQVERLRFGGLASARLSWNPLPQLFFYGAVSGLFSPIKWRFLGRGTAPIYQAEHFQVDISLGMRVLFW